MNIQLRPVDDSNREAVLALSVREDQPFVAPNDVSLRQAAETNAEHPGAAHHVQQRDGGRRRGHGKHRLRDL